MSEKFLKGTNINSQCDFKKKLNEIETRDKLF